MKNIAKIAIIGALMAVGVAQSNAQTTNTVFTTNEVVKSRLTITGTTYTSDSKPVRFANKDVIKLIATQLGVTLAAKARLELVHILTSTDDSGTATAAEGTWRVRLVNGATTIDLSVHIAGAADGADLLNITRFDGISVSSGTIAHNTEHMILHLSFQTDAVLNEANGFGALISTTSAKGISEKLDLWDFAGDGSVGSAATPAVFWGDIHATGGVKDNATEHETIVDITGG